MAKPLKINQQEYQQSFIQGPLAGYSCAPFRKLIWQNASPALCYTEMLPAQQICAEQGKINRFTYRDPIEKTLCYQLSGNQPKILSEACCIVAQMGADVIDLNVGCPKNKIRKKGHGSALLQTPDLLHHCLSAMRRATSTTLFAKIRIDGHSEQNFNNDVMQAIISSNVDAIVVHARHWQDDYHQKCHWQQVGNLTNDCPIPVILNGDLHDAKEIKRMKQFINSQHMMISRGSMGAPHLIHALQTNQPLHFDINQTVVWFKQHILELAELIGEKSALLQARSIIRYYAKPYGDAYIKNLQNLVIKISTLNDLELALTRFLQHHAC